MYGIYVKWNGNCEYNYAGYASLDLAKNHFEGFKAQPSVCVANLWEELGDEKTPCRISLDRFARSE